MKPLSKLFLFFFVCLLVSRFFVPRSFSGFFETKEGRAMSGQTISFESILSKDELEQKQQRSKNEKISGILESQEAKMTEYHWKEESDEKERNQKKTKKEETKVSDEETDLDIENLSRQIKDMEAQYPYPDFSGVFSSFLQMDFAGAMEKIGEWLLAVLCYELTTSKLLMGELVGVILFSAIFSNLSSSFSQFSVGESGFLIAYFILFTIIFSNFTIMVNLFRNTINLLSDFLKILLPVYTLSISMSGNLSSGVIFYEYFMVVVLVVNWLSVCVVLPMIQYYVILELLNHFSEKQNLSKLCESIYFLLLKGTKLLFFLFFGFHLLEIMLVPSFDTAKNSLLQKMIGLVPGAGSVVQTVTGTVIGSAVTIKNTLGVTAIVFLALVLVIPMIKLLLYTVFYLLLSIILEPVAQDRFIKCIAAAQKGGMLLLYSLSISTVLFIVMIAVTALSTNHIA